MRVCKSETDLFVEKVSAAQQAENEDGLMWEMLKMHWDRLSTQWSLSYFSLRLKIFPITPKVIPKQITH